MASKSWTFGYTLARLHNAVEHAVSHMQQSASATYPAALKAGFEALKTKDLTTVVCMSGPAMLPTLNKMQEKEGVVDRLLMRCLPRLTGRSVYTGDVVAIKPPQGTESSLLVRRIAAVEGDEIVSDDPEDTAFTLSKGEIWVLADNEELKPAQAKDSRNFGPLHVDQVLGRILYFVRSATEHGRVQNSAVADSMDEAVLEAELDVDKLLEAQC